MPGRGALRLLESPENPIGWSVKLFTAFGIVVRIHLFTVLFIGAELVRSLADGEAPGLAWAALMMGWLVVIVTIHEFGHCFGARRTGGEADRIVLLPFGGLALVRPPHRWGAHLITTIAGPAVHVPIALLTTVALLALGQAGMVLLNPFAPSASFRALDPESAAGFYWVVTAVWTAHYINIVLLLFNVLIPAFPLDGGRIVQALLWRRLGYRRSMEVATLIGMAGAMVLALVGVVTERVLLVVIAVFCGLACYAERRRAMGDIELASSTAGIGVSPDADGASAADDAPEPGPSRRERREAQRAAEEERTLDELLGKIAEHGMGSLTKRERRTLDSLSKRKRGAGAGRVD